MRWEVQYYDYKSKPCDSYKQGVSLEGEVG